MKSIFLKESVVSSIARPKLLTFDVFGTILDWRSGMISAVDALGVSHQFREGVGFDSVLTAQAKDEQAGCYCLYRDIVARSLHSVLGVPLKEAEAIGLKAGEWPLFPDSQAALSRLMRLLPCVATTNSDRVHGQQIQTQLGYLLSDWVCAEDIRVYKPAPDFWKKTAERKGFSLDRSWWHVAAYGDYDLSVARELGLTCVFIDRPHSVPAPSDLTFRDLGELSSFVERLFAANGGEKP